MAIPDLNQQKQAFFNQKKQDITQQTNQMQQQGNDAINRRFASLGASGSGAALGALQKNQSQVADQGRQMMGDLNAQELQSNEAQNQILQQRQFQTEDMTKQRGFQVDDLAKQQGFQKEMAGQDMGFKQRLADTEQGNKLQELDLARKNFDLDVATTEFNKRIASGGAARDALNTLNAYNLNANLTSKNPTVSTQPVIGTGATAAPVVNTTAAFMYDPKTKKMISNPNYRASGRSSAYTSGGGF